MRLSDVHRRKPKLIYLNHSTLRSLNEAATRRSNRLLEACAIAVSTTVPNQQNYDLNKVFDDPITLPLKLIKTYDEHLA